MMDKLESGRVLLVGEGDFSFSVAFSKHVPAKVKITSTSLLTVDELTDLHKNGPTNVQYLTDHGVQVLHSVDATKLEENESFEGKFDRIIFNFPHVGGKSNIKKNRELLRNFFSSAVQMLAENGDICVSFCQGQGGTPADQPIRAWHDSWQGVGAAAYRNLVLREIWPFSITAYPEYSSTGFRSMDRNFFTGGAVTYVFRRCVPLDVSSISPRLPCGHIEVNRVQYSIGSSYVADKCSRNLLCTKGHPVQLTSKHILHALSKVSTIPLVEHPEPSAVIGMNVETCKPLAYAVTARNECSPNTAETTHISESVQSPEKGELNTMHRTHIRKSLLDHLGQDVFMNELASDTLHAVTGTACRLQPHIDANDLPVQHEVLLALRTNHLDQGLEKVKSIVSSALSEILTPENQFLMTQEFDDHQEWFGEHLDQARLHSLEATYKSERVPEMDACNQVRETGPAAVPQPCKFVKMSRPLGFLGVANSTGDCKCIVGLLNLDSLTMVKYDIPDARLLWSTDPAFHSQFSGLTFEESYTFKPLSMYPPLWRHDLSLWEDTEVPFCEQTLLEIVREVAGNALKRVLLMNIWEEPGTGRVSRCYRMVYQSYEHALSHSKGHEFQDAVRRAIGQYMTVEVR